MNLVDPSGHMSWQAVLGIGLGILGILGAAFTGGTSIAAAGSMSAVLAGASTVSMIVGASALVADATGIASAAIEQTHPKGAVVCGWVSFAMGMLSLGTGLAASGYRVVNNATMSLRQRLVNIQRIGLSGRGGMSVERRISIMGYHKIEKKDWPSYLYHYTNQQRYRQILADNYINSSFKNLAGEILTHPVGVYATAIKPNQMHSEDLAMAIFGSNLRRKLVEKTYYYLKLETANIPENTSLFRSENMENVYLIRPVSRDLCLKLRTSRPVNLSAEFYDNDILGRHGRSVEYFRFSSFNPDRQSTNEGFLS